jgi:hypothetical protein
MTNAQSTDVAAGGAAADPAAGGVAQPPPPMRSQVAADPTGAASALLGASAPRRPRSPLGYTAVSLAIVAAIVALAIWAATSSTLVTDLNGRLPLWTFLGLGALLALFTIVTGWAITGEVGGALIDPRKGRMSLSRLQVLAWTILVLSAYLNAFVVNIAAGRHDPLDVAIPGELLIAMGISLASLTGAQAVLGYKQSVHGTSVQTPELGVDLVPGAEVRTATEEDVRASVLKGRRARWRDVFMGDSAEASDSLDLGKVQMFYITVALVVGYGIAVATAFTPIKVGADGGIATLPALNQAFVALLGLSHAGYLTAKATS